VTDLAHLTCRILTPKDGTAGTGIVLRAGYLLTCAHVAAAARSTAPSAEEPVAILFAASGERAEASVLHVGDPKRPAADFALLKTSARHVGAPLLEQAAPGHRYDCFGYPTGWADQGNAAQGLVGLANAQGLIQLEGDGTGFGIRGGFSGAPVWDRLAQAVVGMVTGSAKTAERDPRVGFMLPMATILAHPRYRRLRSVPRFDDSSMRALLSVAASEADRNLAISHLTGRVDGFAGDPADRYWIYHTLGLLGGTRVRAILSDAARRDPASYARSGAEEALNHR
jgi:hypothetical protein